MREKLRALKVGPGDGDGRDGIDCLLIRWEAPDDQWCVMVFYADRSNESFGGTEAEALVRALIAAGVVELPVYIEPKADHGRDRTQEV